jgi:ferredoxin
MPKTMVAIVDEEKCTACGTCVEACPVEAIKLKDKAKIDEENCIDCGTCVDECPEKAISL